MFTPGGAQLMAMTQCGYTAARVRVNMPGYGLVLTAFSVIFTAVLTAGAKSPSYILHPRR